MGITLKNTLIIIGRVESNIFSDKKLEELEGLKTLINCLNSKLTSVTIAKEKAVKQCNLEGAAELHNQEIDIKQKIKTILLDTPSDMYDILNHQLVNEAREINFSNQSVCALKQSFKEAQNLNLNHVSTEHILLGLLGTGDVKFVDFLEELGIHASSLCKKLNNVLRGEEYISGDQNVYVENFVNHGEFMFEKSIDLTARDIINSVVNLGGINGNVTNTIKQLSDSQSPNKSELADLLTQLQSAINSEESGLDDKNKAKALKHIESIGKLGSKQDDGTLREKAEDALDALIGIAGKFASFFGIAKPLIDSVKSLLNL